MDKIIAVSGGFDPLHSGHLRLIEGALALGSNLWVFLNSDEWLIRKKGFYLLPFEERARVILYAAEGAASHFVAHKGVCVFAVTDTDDTVCQTLSLYTPDVFANGGDRSNPEDLPEFSACVALGIELVFGVGGDTKQGSSTDYFKKAVDMWTDSKHTDYLNS